MEKGKKALGKDRGHSETAVASERTLWKRAEWRRQTHRSTNACLHALMPVLAMRAEASLADAHRLFGCTEEQAACLQHRPHRSTQT